MKRWVFACVALVACDQPGATDDRGYVAPADGQSGVAQYQPLLVRGAAADLPADYPLDPATIRVVDLEDGGFVEGNLRISGADLLFVPVTGWSQGHRYAWTVSEPLPEAHGPEVGLNDGLIGSAVFSTGAELDALGAGLDEANGQACVVLSRPLQPEDAARIVVSDLLGEVIPVTWALVPSDDLIDDPWELLPGDEGLAVICAVVPPRDALPDEVRVQWGDGPPTRLLLERIPVADVIARLRREVTP